MSPARAADRLGKPDAEQPDFRRLLVQLPRHAPGLLPGPRGAGRPPRSTKDGTIAVRARCSAAPGLLRGSEVGKLRGEVDVPGAEPLTEPLGLRVEPGGRGHTRSQQPLDHEVDGTEVRQSYHL